MANPIKILELDGEAWRAGLSIHPMSPIGGLFRLASNFDPFDSVGIQRPSLSATQRGSATVTAAGYYNVGFTENSLSSFYSFGDSDTVYRIDNLLFTVTDVSAQIDGVDEIKGVIKYKDKILYASTTTVFAGSIPLALGSQVQILNNLESAEHVMEIAPDRNCYVTNKNHVGRITNVAGTSDNNAEFLTFEDDVIIRDLTSDGKYLIMVGDNNNNNFDSVGRARCFVAFWNMKSQDLSQIWEFDDDITYGLEWSGEDIIVLARDNFYKCRIDSPLVPILPMRGSGSFVSSQATVFPGGIIRRKGSVLWGMKNIIFAYGRPFPYVEKRLYTPFFLPSGNIVSLFSDGRGVWSMTDGNDLYENISGARGDSLILLSDIDFKQPYEFAFAKIILRDALASGESVTLSINTQNGSKLVLQGSTFSFSDHGAVSSFIYKPSSNETASSAPMFQDLTNITISNIKASIRRLEIWGYPIDPTQDLSY